MIAAARLRHAVVTLLLVILPTGVHAEKEPAPAPPSSAGSAAESDVEPERDDGVAEQTSEKGTDPDERHEGLADHPSEGRHRNLIHQDNVTAPRPGNAPIDASYAGFFQIPWTNSWARLGGYAKVDVIADSTKLGNPNKFVTGGIPVRGEANHGRDNEFTIQAKQTRMNLELRSPTPIGALRVVYENDFFGDSSSADMSYNLRQFYGQVANITGGQTWTTFADPDANPDTLDFEGPGVQTMVRQPQLRYTYSPNPHNHLAISIEQPKGDVGALPTTASTRNSMPDFAANWRLEGSPGHVQLAGLVRSIGYEDSAGPEDEVIGWGLNLSGVLHTFGQDNATARLTYGDGLGRYVQDLPGGSAAVVDASGDLETLSVWGVMAAYRHFWSDDWRSEITYGYVDLDGASALGEKAYDETHYAQANLIWGIGGNFYVGVEYLFGFKNARDGSDGEAHRGQLSLQYRLIR